MINKLIHKYKYARTIGSRQETWDETIDRLRSFLGKEIMCDPTYDFSYIDLNGICDSIREGRVMPSMRLMFSAGKAAELENLLVYNCRWLTMDSLEKFPELMYSLMCGVGVGYSVRQRHISELPKLKDSLVETSETIVVPDTRRGWSDSLFEFLSFLFQGLVPQVDFTHIRPEGTPLKTTGGYAPGSAPLEKLFTYLIETFADYAGTHLSSVAISDICCNIAEIVTQGGIRRSACICLFDYDDIDMLKIKDGNYWEQHPYRSNSNNSAYVPHDVTLSEEEVEEILQATKVTGDPGIVFGSAIKRKLELAGREFTEDHGLNPCGEIILRDGQCCNLTEVVVREDDTMDTLKDSIRKATVLGMLQATFTRVDTYIPELWDEAIKEALCGVSLTGIANNPLVRDPDKLVELWETAREIAQYTAYTTGLPEPKAITTVKPSGTVSKLVGVSPGIHSYHAKHFVYNISIPKISPLASALMNKGIVRYTTDKSIIISLPQEAPEGALVNSSVKDQLSLWSTITRNWCDHNCSCTITVPKDEWDIANEFLEKEQKHVVGLSFIPEYERVSGVPYMPIEEISEKQYYTLVSLWDNIDIDSMTIDSNGASPDFACTGGKCEVNL